MGSGRAEGSSKPSPCLYEGARYAALKTTSRHASASSRFALPLSRLMFPTAPPLSQTYIRAHTHLSNSTGHTLACMNTLACFSLAAVLRLYGSSQPARRTVSCRKFTAPRPVVVNSEVPPPKSSVTFLKGLP